MNLSKWQSIETAPQDGKCIVAVKTDNGTILAILDRDKKGNWIHEGEPTFCHSYYYEPVMWTPLPELPDDLDTCDV